MILFVLIPVLSLTGCTEKATPPGESAPAAEIRMESAPDMHDAANSLDYTGTYRGILPCPDCEGIYTELTLVYDNTFTLKTNFMGKGDGMEKTRSGFYSFQKHGSLVTLIGLDPPNRFFVGENVLWYLDQDGKRITGELAEKHALRK